MAVTPQTDIRLIQVPLEIDNENQLTFPTPQLQEDYFLSLPYLEVDKCSYQRKDNYINFPAHIDDILTYNYVMYKNENYTDKYFYGFITDMKYVNDNVTQVYIKTDVFQTWQFDIIYKKMFIEREHVNDDTIGLHTVPENLEHGPYKCDKKTYYRDLDEFVYVIRVSKYINGTVPLITNFGGVISAGGAYVCKTANQVANIIQSYPEKARADAILNVYMVPSKIIAQNEEDLQYHGQSKPIYLRTSINKPSSLDNYTPTNNKLLTFPYCYLTLSNNSGSSNNLRYELFNTPTCNFTIKGVPSVGASIKCLPTNYKLASELEEEGIMMGKYPTLSWSGDEYINWLTQNSVNIGLGITSNLISAVGGVASANPVIAGTALINSGMSIANTLAQIYEHSLTPNSAKGNINGGDINTCSQTNGFFFYQMNITSEYAKIIDNFFSMYGYKINDLKVPNITGRPNWNYVKTINANLIGNIPQADLQELKNMLNNGVTFWHNPSTFLDYSQTNK